ncbi:response regulator [Desulfobulbus rhabdoformis]|jgi:response regulator NasT|uniref:ANTAR domain-containing response regulator n=1 Tax=Desulfobulbus rhabdoformis TaxID=34032 RepID=UPI0019664B43|nr:response regulator [Desulfobulbus rhabdoformis]MBM9613741.1 response regulator [Desulfobulbus rhabdoformis]
MGYRIVIADDEPITRMDIREILLHAGYEVVGEASDGFDAIELCKKLNPDVVLLDIKMPLLDGLKAAHIIHEEQHAKAILLITAYSSMEFIDQAKNSGVVGYVVKPIKEEALIPMIEVGIARGEELSQKQKEIEQTKKRLEARAMIEKAKGVLMKEHNIGEEEAFQMIRKLGMDKRRPMQDIAEIILLNHR